ncbi:MAG: cellulase family glycosylhydrolase, partial [Planctomycetes bacterium]|nr:cellulase family glycosylhydrolase [Planctomycetota bacterium]
MNMKQLGRAPHFRGVVLACSLILGAIGCNSSSSSSGVTPLAPAPVPIEEDPDVAAHWTFDVVSGGLVLDESSGGFHGEVQGATLVADGRVGGALEFAGGTDHVAVDANDLELVRWEPLTIAAWVLPIATTTDRVVIGHGELPTPAFALIQRPGNAVRFEIAGKGSTTGTLPADEWHHVAASYDGSSLTLFVDAVEVDRRNGVSGALPPALSDLGLGGSATGSAGFVGRLDEVWLYSRALTDAEIAALYNSTPPLPITLDDATGSTIRDYATEIPMAIDAPDPSAVTVEIVDPPLAGAATPFAAAPGNWIIAYEPDPGFVGTDTFTVQGVAGSQLSNVATVTVTVVPPPSRGRVQVIDGQVVADNGMPLRGETVTIAAWNLGVFDNPHHWLELRDQFDLNAVRLLLSRPPQFYTGGPGFACDPPEGQCYALDHELTGTTTVLDFMDTAVEMARRMGIYLIVDYHPVGGHDAADAMAWWAEIAPRYAEETHVIYELCNEPVQWGPDDYTADDVAFEAAIYAQVRAAAPDTHLILWTFSQPNGNLIATVAEGATIDYDNASIGFHPYASDLSSVIAANEFYPVIETEIGGTLGPGSYHQNLVDRTQQHESLGFSWIWLNGAKTTIGPASDTDAILPSEVTWPSDPGVLALDATPPVAPDEVVVEALAWNRVELTWSGADDPETGILHYRVRRDGVVIAEPYRPGFLDTTIAPASSAEYRISSVNGMGLESPNSDPVVIDTPVAPSNPFSLHWTFTDGSGAVAGDGTGLGQDGMVVGPTWVTIAGQTALYFDGLGAHVTLPDAAVLAPMPSHGDLPGVDFTVTATIQPFSTGSRMPIVAKQGDVVLGPRRGFLFELTEANALRVSVSSGENPESTVALTSSAVLPIGSEFDVAFTYGYLGAGVARLRIYIDGNLVASTDDAVGPIQANPQPFVFFNDAA